MTLRYRRWASQTVASEDYRHEKAHAFRLIEEAINTRRARDGRPPSHAPNPDPASRYAPTS